MTARDLRPSVALSHAGLSPTGSLLGGGRSQAGRRSDLIVAAGWLSSLLSISAAGVGDQAAALVWCSGTERCGRDAGYPELLGWAALTRAMIAYYQGHPRHSAAVARRGQDAAPPRTVAYAKLAAQEMRSLAMLGDAAGMADGQWDDQVSPSRDIRPAA